MALRPDEAEWGRDLPFPPEYEPLDVLPMVAVFGLCLTAKARPKDRLNFAACSDQCISVAFDPLTAWPVPKRQPKAGGEESQAINHGSE